MQSHLILHELDNANIKTDVIINTLSFLALPELDYVLSKSIIGCEKEEAEEGFEEEEEGFEEEGFEEEGFEEEEEGFEEEKDEEDQEEEEEVEEEDEEEGEEEEGEGV
ncbi:Hypothetical predicted protein [Octopus vulgaris]|uniref:Uncharacterized protein n=1 Tax=Octopus vulgaris TaxID=6645 RepID=A0AA36BBX0_OCTVU|nr:Hypothetical predicted protein [Octopus vulgaris]